MAALAGGLADLAAADSGKRGLMRGHGLPGEDAAQFVRAAFGVPVKRRLQIASIGERRVPGELAFQLGASLAGGPAACRLGTGDEDAGGKVHASS